MPATTAQNGVETRDCLVCGTPETRVISKLALGSKINEAKEKDNNAYTPESWAGVANALENARRVAENPQANQSAIDSALQTLQNALNNLRTKAPARIPGFPSGTVTLYRKEDAGYFKKFDNVDITWTVSNSKCFTINDNGEITFKTAASYVLYGNVTVTAWQTQNGQRVDVGHVDVKVTWTFGKWLLVIFLFGWAYL
jgi:hypothetical protein